MLVFIQSLANAQTHYEEIIRYKNGNIKSIISYNSNNIKDGQTINYYPNGNIQSYIPYMNGNINGVVENYYKNEILESTGIIVDNLLEGKFYYFHKNGKPKSIINFEKNKPKNIEKCFDKKSNILYCGPFNNGNGEIYIYDENGNLISKDHFKNGEFVN